MSELGKSKDTIYANSLDLDKLSVFMERSGENPMFLEVEGLPSILTYGKHYATISFKDPPNSPYKLKQFSKISFEVKDADGNLIFSDIANSGEIKDNYSGTSIFYIWIKEDPLRTYNDIKNGIGTLTFVGELDGVPPNWQNKPNYKCVFPIDIRTDLPNTSPILFQSSSLIHSNLQLSESIELDTDNINYKRSYLNVSASNMETFGGKVEFIELAYREIKSLNNEFTVFNTYPLSSSTAGNSSDVFEVHSGSSVGLNPKSDHQKFTLPREIRRHLTVDFRLRFLNKNLEPARDLRTNNSFVEVSQSLVISGSPLILEKNDNLVSGSLVFGKSVEDGVKMVYDKDLERLDFVAGSSTTFGAGGSVSALGSGNEKTIFSMKVDDAASGSMDVEGDLRVTGDVIAENYIVSSSVINKVTLDVSGSTNFGNDPTDKHSMTGSLEISRSAADGIALRVEGDIRALGEGHYIAGTTDFAGGINVTGDSVFTGNQIQVDGYINGYTGNTTSYIDFQFANRLTLYAKAEQMIDMNGNSDIITFGDGGDIDYKFQTSGESDTLFIEGSSNNIGIGTDAPSKKLTVEGDISASGTIYGSDLHISGSGETVVGVHNTGNNLLKWEWHRDNERKWLIYNDGRTTGLAGQDSLVFKHGVVSDGDDHINFYMKPDDQSVYFEGEISASSTITSKTGFVGETQTTGSYDFPGAIMGYTNIGATSGHGS